MMYAHELQIYLDDFLKAGQFADYAPNGLQIAGETKIKKVGLAVSASLDVIEKAAALKCQALLVHHGLIWNHHQGKTITGSYGEKIKLLMKHGINLFAYHLPLDAHTTHGNAAFFAKEFELMNQFSFGSYKQTKVGIAGELKQTVERKTLKARLEKICNRVVYAPKCLNEFKDKKIKRLGIVTGSGANYWTEAKSLGLDALITGEMSEYHWFDSREEGIYLFAAGHHATEQFGVKSLGKLIQEQFDLNTVFIISDNEI